MMHDSGGPLTRSEGNPVSDVPRRVQKLKMVPAEKAIQEAVDSVEQMPAHPLLTDAVNLLAEARRKVADFVDLKEWQPAAHPEGSPLPCTCPQGGPAVDRHIREHGESPIDPDPTCPVHGQPSVAAPEGSPLPPQEAWKVTRLRSALENWGRHHEWCGARKGEPCTCGLREALEIGTEKEWYRRMAEREGNMEISAGRYARTPDGIPEFTGSADGAVGTASSAPPSGQPVVPAGEPRRCTCGIRTMALGYPQRDLDPACPMHGKSADELRSGLSRLRTAAQAVIDQAMPVEARSLYHIPGKVVEALRLALPPETP